MTSNSTLECPSCGVLLDATTHLDKCIFPNHLLPLVRGINLIRCPNCDSNEPVTWEGFCPTCGESYGVNVIEEIILENSPSTFAISNKGIRHETNQDSVWIGNTEDTTCIVLCDGVSSAYRSEFASRLVAYVTGNYILQHLSTNNETQALLAEAARQAKNMLTIMIPASAIPKVHCVTTHDVPSATIVAAVIHSDTITLGWLGDSRAYWLTADEITLLTNDDSYASMLIEEGKAANYIEALNMPDGHAITACVAEDCSTPMHVKSFPVTASGMLILCSDGLWNYLIDEVDFGLTINDALQGTKTLVEALQHLVQFACEQGGSDNISIAFHEIKATVDNHQIAVDLP